MDSFLIKSAAEGNLEEVKHFISQGANVNAQEGNALIYAASNGHLDVVKYLVEYGIDVNAQEGLSLIYAARSGNLPMIEYLVSQGANVNAQGGLPLIEAAQTKYLSTAEYLLQHGANISARKYEALSKASSKGNIVMITYLLPLVREKDRQSVLDRMLGVAEDHTLIKLLVSLGADINYNKGQTLLNAAQRGDLKTLIYLVSKGANPSIRGKRALYLASHHEHYDTVRFLLDMYSTEPDTEMPSLSSLEMRTLVERDISSTTALIRGLEGTNKSISSLIVRYY